MSPQETQDECSKAHHDGRDDPRLRRKTVFFCIGCNKPFFHWSKAHEHVVHCTAAARARGDT